LTNVRPGKLQGGHPNDRAEALFDDQEWNGQQHSMLSWWSLNTTNSRENNNKNTKYHNQLKKQNSQNLRVNKMKKKVDNQLNIGG